MKRVIIVYASMVLCITPFFGEVKEAVWGAKAAASAKNPGIEQMLQYAIEDEYLARAEYEAIMKKFGTQPPFSNIIKAEETHIGWIVDVYKKLKLTIPEDRAKEFVVLPVSLEEAFKTGVQAEIDNIAMYERFIAEAVINTSENKYLQDLFVKLRDASKNHLQAFENGLK